jgi:putative copper export protein/methionine-rich copper-binding protein CopC
VPAFLRVTKATTAHRLRRLCLAGSALTSLVVLGWTAPAAAHAAVVSSSPVQGQHLPKAPHEVTIVFDQPVQPDDGGLVVLDSNGIAVQVSSRHPRPDTLEATLPASLGSGAYVSNYTVTSVDGHVVNGGIVFLAGNVKAGAITALARPKTTLTNWVDDFGQFLVYLGVLVAAGLAFFVAFVLRGGGEERRLRRVTYLAAAAGIVGMAVTGAAQSVLTGGGVASIVHWSVERQSFGGKFGQQCAVQLVGLAVCVVSFGVRATMTRQFAAFYGLVIAAGAFVLFGHALVSPERWLSTPADVVHVVFAAMWAGGLVGLLMVLRTRLRAARRAGQFLARSGPGEIAGLGDASATSARPINVAGSAAGSGATATALLERPPPLAVRSGSGTHESDNWNHDGHGDPDGCGDANTQTADDGGVLLASTAGVISRFSTMAGISFAGIIVAGTLLAVVEVGSVANLFETGYGQLLLLKIAVVGLLLFLAGYNRYFLLPGLLAASAAGRTGVAEGWRRLVSTVRLEVLGMVAVLGITAVLANGTPSNGASAPPPVAFIQTQPFDGGHVMLHITPNAALVNNWTVQFTGANRAPADLAESVSVYLVLPSENVGPIETDMKRIGVGRFVLANSPNPPIVGKWQIVLQVQVSEFSQPDVSFVDAVQ